MRVMCLIVLFAGAAAAQENPAVAVVKAAIEAHGGADALNKARTGRSVGTGSMTTQGREMKIAANSAYALPEKYRMDVVVDLGGSKLIVQQILNGKKIKVSAKLNGTEQPTDPRVKEETIQAGLLQDISLLTPLLDKKYTLKLEKDADVSGQSAAVVLVSGGGLKDTRLFFDKKSNRLVKTQRRGFANGDKGVVEVEEEIYLSDFKAFDKALLPTAMVVNHDGKKFMAMTVTEIKFAEKIDDKEFAID